MSTVRGDVRVPYVTTVTVCSRVEYLEDKNHPSKTKSLLFIGHRYHTVDIPVPSSFGPFLRPSRPLPYSRQVILSHQPLHSVLVLQICLDLLHYFVLYSLLFYTRTVRTKREGLFTSLLFLPINNHRSSVGSPGEDSTGRGPDRSPLLLRCTS